MKNIYLKCILGPKLATTDQNKFITLKGDNLLTNKARKAWLVPF